MKNSVIITDTSCFTLLEKIKALDILHKLFATVLTTPEIAKEYRRPLPEWVIVQHALNIKIQEKFHQLVDLGEASAIALASEVNCDYLILDDSAARKLAYKLGLPVKGTVGVLLLAKQKEVIPEFRPYLEMVQQTNFRLSQKLADDLLKEAGEW